MAVNSNLLQVLSQLFPLSLDLVVLLHLSSDVIFSCSGPGSGLQLVVCAPFPTFAHEPSMQMTDVTFGLWLPAEPQLLMSLFNADQSCSMTDRGSFFVLGIATAAPVVPGRFQPWSSGRLCSMWVKQTQNSSSE